MTYSSRFDIMRPQFNYRVCTLLLPTKSECDVGGCCKQAGLLPIPGTHVGMSRSGLGVRDLSILPRNLTPAVFSIKMLQCRSLSQVLYILFSCLQLQY